MPTDSRTNAGIAFPNELYEQIEAERETDQAHEDFQSRSEFVSECVELGLLTKQMFDDFEWADDMDQRSMKAVLRQALIDMNNSQV